MNVSISHSFPSAVEAKREFTAGYNSLRKDRVRSLLRMLVLGTPVDTGEARGGWEVSISAPATIPGGRLDKEGTSTIARGVDVLNGLNNFANVFVSNPVPHFQFLEKGSSPQAPNGVIRVMLPALKGMYRDVV